MFESNYLNVEIFNIQTICTVERRIARSRILEISNHYSKIETFVTAKLEIASKETCSGTSLADSGATRILLILSLLLTGLTTLPHIQHDVRGIV